MNQKVSIIVPIYNVSKYLDTCIESIIKQTYTNLEIILVNDGSTDNSDDICKKWEQVDKRIIYINQKNSGVSVARNNGLTRATGEYVSFVDGDDYLEPNMIEKLHNFIIKNKVKVAMCGYYFISSQEKKEIKYFNKDRIFDTNSNKKELLEQIIQFLGVPWGKLYSKDFLINNNIQFKVGLKRMQDTIFTLEAFELCDKIAYLNEPLYDYRYLQNSVCNKYSPDFSKTAKNILKYFKEYLDKYNLMNDYEYLYYTKMILLIIEMIKLQYIPDECDMPLFKKIRQIKLEIKSFHPNFNLVSKQFLDNKSKIGFFLLKHHFYLLFYIIYKLSYKNKKRKYYKKDDQNAKN